MRRFLSKLVVLMLSATPAAAQDDGKSGFLSTLCFASRFNDATMPLTDRIVAYGNCVKTKERNRIGKYFCYVDKMVVVHTGDDGSSFHGRVEPEIDKFFVTITEIDDEYKRISCDLGDYGFGNSFGDLPNNCLANFKIELSPEFTSYEVSVSSYEFTGHLGGSFILYGTGKFVQYRNLMSAGYYLSVGRCEKIN